MIYISLLYQKQKFVQQWKQSNITVVFNQLFYPGWVVTIDGVEAQILAVNILSQGIVVPAGLHVIKIFIQTIIFFYLHYFYPGDYMVL